MINAPQVVIDALESRNFSYADLIKVNLGDAFGLGPDHILYLTNYGHEISFGGNVYTPDNNLVELQGISRKASTGSDSVDIIFSVTDENLIDAIRSERYINKPTSIERVLINEGIVIGNFSIPVRTAWGISHSISGDIEDRSITLTIDSSLGDLNGNNGWFAINASHEQRYLGDKIMRHGQTVMTEEQQKKYTANFRGIINEQVKPPALLKNYGYANIQLIPICMLKHRKTHSSYRHYFTTLIYCINIGECDHVDIKNLRKGDEKFDFSVRTDTKRDVGGWSVRIRTPNDALAGSLLSEESNGDLSFWFEGMDTAERSRMNGMVGKGLTLLFVKNRNRDDWLSSTPKLTVPARASKVLDTRTGQTVYSRNPILQYADFLRSTEYGAGKRGISITDANISELADHFEQIPDSIGNAGINSILIDIQLDTADPIVDNMNIWMEGVRLYTSDYYGKFNVRVETKSPVVWVLDELELIEYPDYDSGEFTDRLNQLTYTIKQMVQDTSDDAISGDLVEVDVKATFPKKGSQIHTNWLNKDSGIVNFESEQLDYVTVLEQAYYWVMVDSRVSRQPRTLDIKVGPKGWLSEVGDVLDFSSSVMDMTNTKWRVDEVSEDGGNIELNLVAYDDNFYTPDPDSIPDPVGLAQPPTAAFLSPVTGLSIIEKGGLYYLDWLPLSTANVSWYAVEITRDSTIIFDEPKIAQPPLLLESIIVGDYEAKVTAIGINDEGEESLFTFAVALPETPTVTVNPTSLSVEVIPSVTTRYLGSTFQLLINTVNTIPDISTVRESGAFTVTGLNPDTIYYLWVRTVNVVGESDWATQSFTTLDGSEFNEIFDLDEIQIKLDQIPLAAQGIVNTLLSVFTETNLEVGNIKTGESLIEETKSRVIALDNLNEELKAFTNGKFPITSTQITDGAISTPKLAANAVTASKILALSIGTDKLSANAVTIDKMSANSVNTEQLLAGAVLTDTLGAGSVVADKVAVGTLTGDKFVAETITAREINVVNLFAQNIEATGSITGGNIIGGDFTSKENGGYYVKIGAASIDMANDTIGTNTKIRSTNIQTLQMTAQDFTINSMSSNKGGNLNLILSDIINRLNAAGL